MMSKLKRLRNQLQDQDLQSFAKLYDIQKQMKRLFTQESCRSSLNIKDKQLLSLGLTLGSKFPQIQDTIHTSKQSRQVKQVLNVLSQMIILLTKYKKLAKNLSQSQLNQIDNLDKLYKQIKKKNINDQFTAMQYYELENAVAKVRMEFQLLLCS